MESRPYPVRIEGELDPNVGRWLWLVKWLLAIPHYIVLAFLWLTVVVLTVIVLFAILFTGRYPRGIFDFNLGVFRWTWRVAFYSYGALGTDRYPPFTLDDVADYPARLHVEYPERLSRGLVLVKWWLLAIPHYIVVGILLGGGSYATSKVDDRVWNLGFETGLIGVLVFFAGVALLFTTRYPRGLFDFVLGLDRWVVRVAAYVFLMRDEYPPFRLDQGGSDAPLAVAATTETAAAVVPAEQPRRGGTGGRVALIVLGTIAGVIALGLLAGGCALVGIDRTQRDDDGFVMSPTRNSTRRRTPSSPRAPSSIRTAPSGRSTRSSARCGSGATAIAPCSSASDLRRRSTATSKGSSTTSSTTSTRAEIPSTRGVRAAHHPALRAPRPSGPRLLRDRASRRSSGIPRTATGGRSS